jgi:hypothetical protein
LHRDPNLIGAVSVLLSFGGPGIPSGSLVLVAPLYTSLGLPVEGVGILIALDALPDIFKTVSNVTADMAAIAILARGSRVSRATVAFGEGAGSSAPPAASSSIASESEPFSAAGLTRFAAVGRWLMIRRG